MSIIWLIFALVVLVNQAPSARGQLTATNTTVSTSSRQTNVCPSGCQCNLVPGNVTCSLNTSSLPTAIPTNTTALRLNCSSNATITPQNQMFTSLPSLQTLEVWHCFNGSLVRGMFDGLNSLRFLLLEDNRIPSLRPGIFRNAPNMSWLSLVDNSISSIERATFTGVPRVGQINLESNQLTSIHVDAFEELQTANVQFGDNPLVCDCYLAPVLARFKNSNLKMRCPDVNSLGNRTWAELNETVLQQVCPTQTTTTQRITQPNGEIVTEGVVITTSENEGTSITSREPVMNVENLILYVAMGVIVVLIIASCLVCVCAFRVLNQQSMSFCQSESGSASGSRRMFGSQRSKSFASVRERDADSVEKPRLQVPVAVKVAGIKLANKRKSKPLPEDTKSVQFELEKMIFSSESL